MTRDCASVRCMVAYEQAYTVAQVRKPVSHLRGNGTSIDGASVTVTAAPGHRAIGSSARVTAAVLPEPAPAAFITAASAGMARRLGVVRKVLPSPLGMHTLRAGRR